MRNRVVIASDGNITRVVINGTEYKNHITKVDFHHDCNGKPQLEISTRSYQIRS